MRLLVLGGTIFLGRHLVERALADGHDVTLFTRGRHNPELFSAAERLRGDRGGDLTALRGRSWDAVVDTSGHLPRAVRASARLLAPRVRHYTFVSTLGVYADLLRVTGLDESARVDATVDPATTAVNRETMGPLKALCEREVAAALPGRALVVRAGLLAGPYDPTGRFGYWPRRVARGGEILAPGRPELGVQIIDARDLAAWILDATVAGLTGTYNATGPAGGLTLGGVLDTCRAEVGADGARFTWVDDRFITDNCRDPMWLLPLWAPGMPTAPAVRCWRAIRAGLRFRPLAETVRDTLAWDLAHSGPRRGALTPEHEAELLSAWHTRARP